MLTFGRTVIASPPKLPSSRASFCVHFALIYQLVMHFVYLISAIYLYVCKLLLFPRAKLEKNISNKNTPSCARSLAEEKSTMFDMNSFLYHI